MVVLPTAELRNGVIPRLDVEKAAKLLQMNHNTVRRDLQQGVFLGVTVYSYIRQQMGVYFINAKRFAEIEGQSVMPKIQYKEINFRGKSL